MTRLLRASVALAAGCVRTLALATVGGATARLPLAPLSSLGTITPAPRPGPVGPEGVPVPRTTTVLAGVRPVRLGERVDGITCQQTEKRAYHIHAHLTIFVDGKPEFVPYGIGIGPTTYGVNTPEGPFITVGSCFMWLNTHALDGVIHVESPTKHVYTLAQFFAVWGRPLSRTQVGPAKGKVTALYDGKVWTGAPGAIPLTSEVQIQLDVGTPIVAPEHITFPATLAPSGSLGTK